MVCSGWLPFFRNFGKDLAAFRAIEKIRATIRRISIERTGIPVALYVWQQSWDKLTEMIAVPAFDRNR